MSFLYQDLENEIRNSIESGQWPAGSRLPSIRLLCQEREVSKSTVLTAYGRLEAEGLIETRPRSGYFVCMEKPGLSIQLPRQSQPRMEPALLSADQVLMDMMEQGVAFDLLTGPDGRAEGNQQLRRCLVRAQRRQGATEQDYYDEPAGLLQLRRQLSGRMAQGGSRVDADELVITQGCQHSLMLALMATTDPGDVVAVESPGFYGCLQLIQTLGRQVIELPSSAATGVSPDALELAINHWPLKALVVSPAYATPTGACMPDSHKQRILELAVKHDIAIIEDDIYGDLTFDLQRPRTLHSFDDSGSVLLCSSFSKSLSRDLRLGWIAPGRYLQRVKQLKLVTSLANSRSIQQGVAIFLAEGSYDRHLRRRRQQLRDQCLQLQQLVLEVLPSTVACSQPDGGLALWLELPERVDTLALYARARPLGIAIAPGRLFTAQEHYQNCLRLSFMHPWTAERRRALQQLAELIGGR